MSEDEYDSGFDAITRVVKEQNERRAQFSAGFKGLSHWGWKAEQEDGDAKIARMLSNRPVVIKMHNMFKCPDGKRRDFICANALKGGKAWDCPICKIKYADGKSPWPSEQGLMLAAYREEKPKEGGGLEVVDWFRRNEDGSSQELVIKIGDVEHKDKDVPWIGLIKQSVGNFWSGFNAYYARYGSVVDRDYQITRSGSKQQPNYVAIPLDPIEGLKTEEEVRARYAVALKHHMSLVDYIESYGSESYYGKFITGDAGAVDQSHDNSNTSSTSTSSEQPANPASETPQNDTQMTSLRDELVKYQGTSS